MVVTCCLLLQTKGEHGADVTLEARPLPLEYLIIELTTSSPRNPLPLLPGGKGVAFPVENRASVGQAVQVRVAVCPYHNMVCVLLLRTSMPCVHT